MLKINTQTFLNLVPAALAKHRLMPQAHLGLQQLLDFLQKDMQVSDLRWAAYMLATVQHECAGAWRPVVEHGTRDYFNKYDLGTRLGKRLGNTQPGDGYLFRGRGYVQITGRTNYRNLGRLLQMGDSLVETPGLVLQPETAYRIMSLGMTRGSFTGKKLADFIHGPTCDYLQARRIINGLDQNVRIQGYAIALEKILHASTMSETVEAASPGLVQSGGRGLLPATPG